MIAPERMAELVSAAFTETVQQPANLTDAMQVVVFEFILRELITDEHEAMDS